MRMAGVVALGVLLIEALLAGVFALGFYWLDGWRWGLLFSGVLLLLMVLPWLGELKVVFDSAGPKGAVKVGWWGRVSFARREETGLLVVRVLGIPIRRMLGEKEQVSGETEIVEAPSEFEPAAEAGLAEERTPAPTDEEMPVKKVGWWQRIDSEMVEAFCRITGSSLGATCELVWGADEIRVSVQDVTGNEIADSVIEQVFGRREIGPVDLALATGGCDRRVRAIYRIGLLRAAFAGVQVVIDGRVPQFAKQMNTKRKKCVVIDEEQRIINEILKQQEGED